MTIADLATYTRNLCDADSTSFTNANLLIYLNAAYEEIIGKIIQLDGTWQFDDSNYTDLPIATATLVAGQNDYSFNSAHLEVLRVAIKDSSGKFFFIQPVDLLDERSQPLEEIYNVNGLPERYDKYGSSIFVHPAPASGSVTLTAGLKVWFQRTASVYTSAELTTGTKQPGFAAPYHHILAYKSAIPYCMSYKRERVPAYMAEAQKLERELLDFMGRREKDVPKGLSMSGISFQ